MDNLFENQRLQGKANSENSFDCLALREKFFIDGYEITPSFKHHTPLMAEQKELVEQIAGKQKEIGERQSIYKQAIKQTIEKLLIEILFLEALYRYYGLDYSIDQFNSTRIAPPAPNRFKSHRFQPHIFFHDPVSDLHGRTTQSTRHFLRHFQFPYSRPPIIRVPAHLDKPFIGHAGTASNSSSIIVNEARHNIGQPVWASTKFAGLCQSGNLGCAATVSELLQNSGIKIAGSACVSGVVGQLADAGWHKIKISDKQQFHTGDIVFGLRGSHAHIGIISQANDNQVLVCDNSSSSGTLKERRIESGGSFSPEGRFAGNLYVMRQNG